MIDYKQNEDNDCDLDFSSGDLQVTESTGQHQRDIILSSKGDIRDTPERGVGSILYIQDTGAQDYLRAIRMELAADGQKVRSVGMANDGSIIIDAEYENS